MPEPKAPAADGGEGEGADNTQKPQADAFGEVPADPQQPPAAEKKEEKKTFEPIPDDHPTIVSLKEQIEKVRTDYGTNLSGQRELITKLEKKITDLTGGAGGGEGGGAAAQTDFIFDPKNIKRSKDLTKEQREDMTETEIAQMDEIAEMKEAMNKQYADTQKGKKVETETKQSDLQGWVKGAAKELAKKEDGTEDTALANLIIESVKQFNLEGLTEAEVKERVLNAAKLVPDYKPPKEQKGARGKTLDGGNKGEDPFGSEKIIEEATAAKGGNYSL